MEYPKQVLHWINGTKTEASFGESFAKIDPASGQEISQVVSGNASDVAKALDAAAIAYEKWSQTDVKKRAELLGRAAEILDSKKQEAAEILAHESGNSVKLSLGEVGWAVKMGNLWAGQADNFSEVEELKSSTEGRIVKMIKQSLGVGALITPYNTQLAGVAAKSFPALLCGNTVVLKSHEDTPYTAVWFGQILKEAGLPDGVYNVIQGKGAEVGEPLTTDERVKFISFTGSAMTARAIIKASASRLTKVMVEAGGKNPIIVCDDADLEKAVDTAVASGFVDTGQRCASGSRIIIMEQVYDKFKTMYLDKIKAMKSGTSDDDDLGAIINERRLNEILAQVEKAVKNGATLLIGGKRIERKGYFIEPTVLENVGPKDEISRAEVFGPVVVLYKVKDLDEAIALANDSDYKLTGAIHTTDAKKGDEFLRRYKAGVARVNGPTHGSEPHTPFGGLGLSGNGWKETGWHAMYFYSDLKQTSTEGELK